jgi:hypothetical protein
MVLGYLLDIPSRGYDGAISDVLVVLTYHNQLIRTVGQEVL